MSALKSRIRAILERMLRRTNHSLVRGLFGYDAFADIELMLRGRQSPVLFDIGANIGQTAAEFASRWPNSQIYAFEPIDECFRSLRSATARFPNVSCERCA